MARIDTATRDPGQAREAVDEKIGGDRQLFAAHGALARYPGAAAVVSGSGAVVAANPAAESLLAAVHAGACGNALDLIARAARGEAVVETVTVSAARGPTVMELSFLPFGDGRSVLILGRDITLDRNLRNILVESRQRYKDLVEISSDFAWETGPDGAFDFVSPRGALGYTAEELVGRRPRDLVIGVVAEEEPLPFLTDRPVEQAELWFRRADGEPACLVASAIPIPAPEGQWRGARGVCRDVTEQRRRDAALERARNRERLLTRIVRAIRDEVDPENILAVAAGATAHHLASPRSEIHRYREEWGFEVAASHGGRLEKETIEALLARAVESADPVALDTPDGEVLAAATRYRRRVNGAIAMWRPKDKGPWHDDDRAVLAGVADQLGIAIEQIANHEALRYQSRTDALTGLLNRRGFIEDLERRLTRQERAGRPAALIYVDLDNFKPVNDVHGHKRGDELLQAAARLLVEGTRPGDLVARLGGDEFAIWLEGADAAVARERAEAVLDGARSLGDYSGSPDRPVGLSLGVAVFEPGENVGLDVLFARADAAMYGAKRGGKGAVRIFRAEEDGPAA